jgi:GT2 family glycosyltransferase
MIYLIVPTFGRVNSTRDLLNSLSKSLEYEYLVLIVDDHPEKITFKDLQDFDNIKILTPKNELWWVGCINLGIQTLFEKYNLTDKDIVIFANNDVQIDKKSFNMLYCALRKDGNQIVHPRTFDQNNFESSSGAKVLSYLPYITRHPKKFKENKILIDMGVARFLCMTAKTLKEVGFINDALIQYGGDNDFTLRALRHYNIKTYILRDATCHLDDTNTGIKNINITNFRKLLESFTSIRSPNNIYFRYQLFKGVFNRVIAIPITASLTINTLIKFFLKKIGL